MRAAVLQVAGAGCLIAAGFMIGTLAGLVLVGVALLVAGFADERGRS